jgi:hypothetical protein
MSTKKKNNLLKWFIEEGALQQKDNLYLAEQVFCANSFINWIRRGVKDKTLSDSEIEQNMRIIRLFLQKKINLEWKNGIIDVTWSEDTLSDLDEPSPGRGEERNV